MIPNKRNGQKQKDHLEEARAIRDIRMKRQNRDWRDGNGRPSAERKVEEFMRENPEAKKCDVIRGTGLDKKTVYKHYEAAKEKAQAMRGEPVIIAETDTGAESIILSSRISVQRTGRMGRM